MVRTDRAGAGRAGRTAVVERATAWLAFALALAALALLPFLLVSTPGWDGWAHYALFVRGEARAVVGHMVANGRPLGGWAIVQPMAWFGALYGTKLVMAACVLGMAACVFLALRAGRLASAPEAALAAVLTVCGPALQSLMAAAMPQYFIGGLALFAGLWLFLLADQRQGAVRGILYAAAVLLAVLAALFGEAPLALLPVYPALLVASRAGQGFHVRAVLRRWPELLRHSAPMVAGALALALQFRLFPDYGAHAGAHDLLLEPLQLARNARQYLWALGVGLWPVLVLVIALVLGRLPWRALGSVGFGAGVLFLGLLPYWIAGRVPVLLDWDVRLLLFSGLGAGLIALALLRASWQSAGLARCAAAVAVVAALNAAWPGVRWALRQATDDAVAQLAALHPAFRQSALVAVRDPGRVVAGPYRHYEWTAMIQQAAGRSDILAVNQYELAELAIWTRYLREDLPLLKGDPLASGCQMLLRIPVRSDADVWRAWQGMWWRATQPDYYRQWLKEAIPLQLTTFNCRRRG
jgi:hypothetical protein